MPSNLRLFAETTTKRAQAIQANVGALQAVAAKHVLKELVEATPIDTGRAMSNWTVAVGARGAIVYRPEAYSPGKRGSTRSQNVQETLAAGYTAIDGAELSAQTAIVIQNYVPYILRLNDGWSKQAPAGFIQQAFMRGVASVKASGFSLTDPAAFSYRFQNP